MGLYSEASLSPLPLIKLIKHYLLQILVNYARSSKEAEEVCKEVNKHLHKCINVYLGTISVY